MSMFNLTERGALIVAEWNGSKWRVPDYYTDRYGVNTFLTSEEIKEIHNMTGCDFVLYRRRNGLEGTFEVDEI